MKRTVAISLAFVGILVGAGFATGQEVIQYFISFGTIGLVGVVLSGIVMTLAGAVILQLGSYFLADEHNMVFRNVAHPTVSKVLDWSVTFTLFSVGFVMLAGSGSNLQQQFGVPSWVGALAMTILVIVTGFFDVDRVSAIISMITPVIIIAVVFAFVYTLLHLPSSLEGINELAQQQNSPVRPWWLSALNYNGLALILGVSMCLIIGGNNSDPKAAWRGGLAGGLLYMALMVMSATTLFLNGRELFGAQVPMLSLFESIHPVLSMIMVWIIFAMIYNTSIGMFYALGRRLTAKNPGRFGVVFVGVTLLGFAVSFVGFSKLMNYIYPLLGYLGMFMIAVLVAWWAKSRLRIRREARVRDKISTLMEERLHPEKKFTDEDADELEEALRASDAPSRHVAHKIGGEVSQDLHANPDVDYTKPDSPEAFDKHFADLPEEDSAFSDIPEDPTTGSGETQPDKPTE